MTSPYADLPQEAFWSTGVTQRSPFDTTGLYAPKFLLSRKARFATAGSCFAQHIGRSLKAANLDVLDAEPLPKGFSDDVANRLGYGLYSARYGNIYTMRQLRQLLAEAFHGREPSHPIWKKEGRYYDAFRPGVEPTGLPTPDDVRAHRAAHLDAVRDVFTNMDVFVFTLGLTETWVSRKDGTVYPTCPGTIAGRFDPELFKFKNLAFKEIMEDYYAVRRMIKKVNPSVQYILTVSPVPLTATASGAHVEVATTYSKSVLRAVCGALQERFANVDYVPSYEVITSVTARGMYYDTNLRTVASQGVAAAMSMFMTAHDLELHPRRARALRAKKATRNAIRTGEKTQDEICEEALLQVFSK